MEPRRAEGAAHGAADLARDADGAAVVVRHHDRLDLGPILHLKQKLYGPVFAVLPIGDPRQRQSERRLQLLAEGFRDVAHGVEVEDVPYVNPGEHLLGAVFALTPRLELG